MCALCTTHRRQVASAVVGPQQYGQLQEMRQCCLDGAVGTAVCACELGEGCAYCCVRDTARAKHTLHDSGKAACIKYAVPNHIPLASASGLTLLKRRVLGPRVCVRLMWGRKCSCPAMSASQRCVEGVKVARGWFCHTSSSLWRGRAA
jgi:hypothetical protein